VTSLKQIGTSATLLAIPYVMLGTTRQRLVSRNLRNFTQEKLLSAPTDLLWVKWPQFSIIPDRDSHLKFLTENPGPTQMVAVICQGSNTVIGAGVYYPSSGNLLNSVEPNGAGTTNTIGRAGMAAIAAAFTHNHVHTATDSLS